MARSEYIYVATTKTDSLPLLVCTVLHEFISRLSRIVLPCNLELHRMKDGELSGSVDITEEALILIKEKARKNHELEVERFDYERG